MRIESDMREITDEDGESDEREITKRPEKIFYVVTEHKKKIHVANEMNGTGVKKERGEEREAVQTHCSRRNQSKLGYDFVESRKSKYARGDDRGAKYPCCPGPSRLRHGIEFNRHSKECSDFFPPFVPTRGVTR